MAGTRLNLAAAALLLMALVRPALAFQSIGTVSTTIGDCKLSLEFSHEQGPAGPEQWISKRTNGVCRLDLPLEAAAIGDLLEQAKGRGYDIARTKGLFWGPTDEPIVLERAARANLAKFGGKRLGNTDFARLLQDNGAFRELNDALAAKGLKLSRIEVEKVEDLKYGDLIAAGVPASSLKTMSRRRRMTAGALMVYFVRPEK